MSIRIIFADKDQFTQHFDQFFEMYMDAFTTGYYRQYLDHQKNKEYCRRFLDSGKTVLLALDGDKLAGFLVATPASYDYRIPKSLKETHDMGKSLSIAELAVEKHHRRQGIASAMLQTFLQSLEGSEKQHLFVRTPAKNQPAIDLYNHFGFKKSVTIQLERTKKDQSGKFIQTKQYLVKDLR